MSEKLTVDDIDLLQAAMECLYMESTSEPPGYDAVSEKLAAMRCAAPAVQGEPIPAGFALIKLDSRTGKPLVTSEMKAKHIGEYWWDEEAPYYDEHGDLHDYVARHAVPWSLCKEIYKNMASTAMLSAQPAEQQPNAAQLVEALELFVSNPTPTSEDFDMARTALAAYRKQQEGEA